MLIVRPVKDKVFQEKLCKLAQTTYEAAAFAYFAANTEDLGDSYTSYIGLVQFDIDEKGAKLVSVDMMPDVDDMEAMIIMGRSLMCFLYRDLHLTTLRATDGIDTKYCKAFGLCEKDGIFNIDLEDFYASPCKYNGLA